MKITGVEAVSLGVELDRPLRWEAMSVSSKGDIIVRVPTDEGLVDLGEAPTRTRSIPSRRLSCSLAGASGPRERPRERKDGNESSSWR